MMNNALQNLNVLLTRQVKHAQNLISQLAAYQADCHCLPLFEIESLLQQSDVAYIQQRLTDCALAVFVSRNALDLVLPYINRRSILPLATMGPATASYLRAAGFTNLIYPQQPPFDSSALAQELAASTAIANNSNVLIFTGEDGNNLLAEELRSQGANVEIIVLYRRALPSAVGYSEQLLNTLATIDIIIITCVTSLLNLEYLTLSNIGKRLYAIPLLVVSARIEKQAIDMGFLNVYTANSMSDEDMLAALLSWRNLTK